MTVQQRQQFNQFLDGVQASIAKVQDGVPLDVMYITLMDKISTESFRKLVTILVATGRCNLVGEKIIAVPMSVAV